MSVLGLSGIEERGKGGTLRGEYFYKGECHRAVTQPMTTLTVKILRAVDTKIAAETRCGPTL